MNTFALKFYARWYKMVRAERRIRWKLRGDGDRLLRLNEIVFEIAVTSTLCKLSNGMKSFMHGKHYTFHLSKSINQSNPFDDLFKVSPWLSPRTFISPIIPLLSSCSGL